MNPKLTGLADLFTRHVLPAVDQLFEEAKAAPKPPSDEDLDRGYRILALTNELEEAKAEIERLKADNLRLQAVADTQGTLLDDFIRSVSG